MSTRERATEMVRQIEQGHTGAEATLYDTSKRKLLERLQTLLPDEHDVIRPVAMIRDLYVHRLLAHDAWTTRQLLLACRDTSDADLDRLFEMGPGSLRATFDEIISAMEAWTDRLGDVPRRPKDPAAARASIETLMARLDVVAADLREIADRLSAKGRLEEVMSLAYQGITYRFTRGVALVHVATHGMHHRAQAINMMRHLGVEHDIEGDAITWEVECEGR